MGALLIGRSVPGPMAPTLKDIGDLLESLKRGLPGLELELESITHIRKRVNKVLVSEQHNQALLSSVALWHMGWERTQGIPQAELPFFC